MNREYQRRSRWSARKFVLPIANLVPLLCLLGAPRSAEAYSRFGKWGLLATNPRFPVVEVNTCPNAFAQHFTQPWASIRRQAAAAANEWFTSGGVDLRLRLTTDLPAAELRCQADQLPNNGEILYTAEAASTTNGNAIAQAMYWVDGAGRMIKAKITMFAGTTKTGAYQPWAWATNANYPQQGQYDFWAVTAHEFGHALGFHHNEDPDSVLYPVASTGDRQPRKLIWDDISGLRDFGYGYAPTQTKSRHYWSNNNGVTWNDETEPTTDNIIGSPSICYSWRPPYAHRIAQALAGSGLIATFQTTGNSVNEYTSLDVRTPYQPAVACHTDSPSEVIAYIAANDNYSYVRTISRMNNSPWGTSVQTLLHSRNAPALAYSPHKGWYILASSDPDTGKVRTLVSRDHGQSWGWYQEWNNIRTFHPMGFNCQDSYAICRIAWADGNVSDTQLRVADFRFEINGWLYIENEFNQEYQSYGGGVGSDPMHVQFAWRDPGNATTLATGGWSQPLPWLNDVNITDKTLHAAPSIARTGLWTGGYTTWSSFADRYNK